MDFNEVGPQASQTPSQWPGKANLGQPCWGGGTEGTLPQQPWVGGWLWGGQLNVSWGLGRCEGVERRCEWSVGVSK